MLYFLSFYWKEGVERPHGWVGLGLAIGFGLLSKSSFVLIAFPVFGLTFFSAHRRDLGVPAMWSFLKAGALAFMIAAPWWLKNLGPALGYTKFAREQPRNSLGSPSLLTWAKWFGTVVISLIGPALSILIALIVVLAIRKIMIKKAGFDPGQLSRSPS
jgi:4-amino-4-deoxy-L-arabinose transferase-like glycosyltransferase